MWGWRCPATRRPSATCSRTCATAGRSRCWASPPSQISIDWNTVIFNMLTIKGIYGREMYETWYKMTVMLESGLDISPGDHAPFPVHASFRRAST